MGVLALIAEFENDIRRERQMDGIKKARERARICVADPPSRSRSSCESEIGMGGVTSAAS